MLINIKLTRAPETFYLSAPSGENKLRIKIFDATIFTTQVELKSRLLLDHSNVLAMKRKAHYPLTIIRLKYLQ